MGQKSSHDTESCTPLLSSQKTRLCKSLSPEYSRNQNPKKVSMIQKIKNFIHKKHFSSLHLPTNAFPSKQSMKDPPLQRMKNVTKSDVKHSSFSTRVEVDEASKIKSRLSCRMNTKDFALQKNQNNRAQNHRLSLFESMGISPNSSPFSPSNKKRSSQTVRQFSINNMNEKMPKKVDEKNNPALEQKNSHNSKKKSPKKYFQVNTKMQNEIESADQSMDQEAKINEPHLFQSPLIRTTKVKLVGDVSSMLVSNYSEYLRKKKIKQARENDSHFIKKKAMRQMLNVKNSFFHLFVKFQ